jgi:hypothetical protein
MSVFRQGYLDHHESGWYTNAAIGASTNGQGFLGPVSPGYVWYVENVSFRVAHAAVMHLIVSAEQSVPAGVAWDFQGRADLFASATDGARNYAAPIFVPEGHYLIASFTGGTNGDVATVTAQIAIHTLTLHEYSVPELQERQIEQEYHAAHVTTVPYADKAV